MAADIIDLKQYCCLKKKLDSLITIDSIEKLINWTNPCFHGMNWNVKQKFRYILDLFRNDSSPFNVSACIAVENTAYPQIATYGCDAPTTSWNNAYVAAWSIMLTVIVISNIIVLLAMRKSTFKSNNTSLLLSSLAVSDLLVGLFLIPIKIKFTYHNQRFCLSRVFCTFYITADNTFFSASITNLFIICIEKYIALNFPFKYPVWMSRRRTKILLVLAWCNGIIWGTLSNIKLDDYKKPAVTMGGFQCSLNDNYIYTILVAVLVFFIPALIMGRLYYKILTIARYHARGISEAVYYDNNNVRPKNEQPAKYIVTGHDKSCVLTKLDERRGSTFSEYVIDGIHRPSKLIQILYYRKMVFKASKTVAIVYGAFVLCWLPCLCWAIVISFCSDCKNVVWFYYLFVEVLPIFNSMLNPFIYALTNRQFRNAFKEVLMLKKSKHQ